MSPSNQATASKQSRSINTRGRINKAFKLSPMSCDELACMSKQACVPNSYMLDRIIHASYIRWLEDLKIERDLKGGS